MFHSFDIVLVAGLYGSGKTQYVNKYFKGQNRIRVSRFEVRKALFEMTNYGKKWHAANFSEEDDILVKHIERKIIEHNIQKKNKVLVINTFISEKSRKRFINLAKDHHKTIGIIFLDIPIETCISQNVDKSDIVPEQVIRFLNQKKVLPSKREGFNEVMILNKFDPVG